MSEPSDIRAWPDAVVQAPDDPDVFNEYCAERNWSDGLPVVVPTVERVTKMLEYCARPWDEPIANIPPRWGEATPIRLAANAVMAGCRPEYFPLVMLAIEALCEEPFNLYGIQTTTHQCAALVIVNGPIGRELNINSGVNAFGPCRRSNATIGRAVRLALLNIGGGIPGVGDMATFGSPAKYSYCVAENEEQNPWEPLHVERGFPAEATTVTVVGGEGPHNISDHESLTAEGFLRTVSYCVAIPGANNATVGDVKFVGEPLIVFGPEHARLLASQGYSKKDVQQYLFEHARVPVSHFSDETIERRMRMSGRFDDQLDIPLVDRRVPMARCPEDFMIMVLGGAGKHSAFIPTMAANRSVTRALRRPDGAFARSIEEMRRP